MCEAMVPTRGFQTLAALLRDDPSTRSPQPVIDLLRNVVQSAEEEGPAFEALADATHGVAPVLVSSICPCVIVRCPARQLSRSRTARSAENARISLAAWDVLGTLLDKLARYNNTRSWALRKAVGRDTQLQERLRDALASPTVEVVRAACDITAGLVSVPEGAAKEQASRALRDVALLTLENGLCAHLVDLLKWVPGYTYDERSADSAQGRECRAAARRHESRHQDRAVPGNDQGGAQACA